MSRPALALLLSTALAGLLSAACGDAPGARPNVLLISADTLRWDHVGANGYGRNTTPNLDRLARAGVNHREAYAHAPNTAPSHTSVLSSLYPTAHGVFNHGQTLDEDVLTMPEAFRDAGWATAAFTQLNGPTYRQGFDHYVFLESPYDKGKGLGDLAPVIQWVREREGEPFFLFLHSYDVHLPYNPPQRYIDRWAPDYDGLLPPAILRTHVDRINAGELEMTERDYQYILDLYDAELVRYDEILGQLFDALRQLGVFEDTIVVLFSDHGEEFGEHGQWGRHSHTLYNELLRTPLIFSGPGVPATNIQAPVGNVDIAPTLLELAGVSIPDTFMGSSLLPLWAGEERERRKVFAEKFDLRTIVWAGYKYYSDGKLYDLEADPTEQVDVAADNPGVVARMQRALDDWLGELLTLAQEIDTEGPVELTREEKQRLRTLGYLQ